MCKKGKKDDVEALGLGKWRERLLECVCQIRNLVLDMLSLRCLLDILVEISRLGGGWMNECGSLEVMGEVFRI